CGDGKSEAVLRLKNLAQKNLYVAHHFQEPRVQMADDGRGHGAVNARVYARRTWREHQSCRWKQFTNRRVHCSSLVFMLRARLKDVDRVLGELSQAYSFSNLESHGQLPKWQDDKIRICHDWK